MATLENVPSTRHGDKDLIRGSGLFVSETGIATNHHFNPVNVEKAFRFSGGVYSLELVAKVVGSERLISLWKVELELPARAFESTIERETAVFYNWSPEQNRYVASIEGRTGAVHALSESAG